jgi:hypothetical protein
MSDRILTEANAKFLVCVGQRLKLTDKQWEEVAKESRDCKDAQAT